MEPIFSIRNFSRKKQYEISTVGYKLNDGSIIFKKSATNEASKEHLQVCYKNHLSLSEDSKNKSLKVVPPKGVDEQGNWVSFDFINAKSLEEVFLENILSLNTKGVKDAYDKLLQGIIDISKTPTTTLASVDLAIAGAKTKSIIDINLDNIFVKDRYLQLIDCEWVSSSYIEPKLIATRAIYYFLQRNSGVLRAHSKRLGAQTDKFGALVPKALVELEILTKNNIIKMLEFENIFQTAIGHQYEALDLKDYKIKHIPEEDIFGAVNNLELESHNLNLTLEARAHEIEVLQTEVSALKEDVQLQSGEVERLSGILHSPVKITKSTAKYILKKVKAKK